MAIHSLTVKQIISRVRQVFPNAPEAYIMNLINEAINKCKNDGGGFVCSYKMKSVNMLKLAKLISNDVEIVGLRPGEKLNEDLINVKEIPFTYIENDMIYIYNEKINENYT